MKMMGSRNAWFFRCSHCQTPLLRKKIVKAVRAAEEMEWRQDQDEVERRRDVDDTYLRKRSVALADDLEAIGAH